MKPKLRLIFVLVGFSCGIKAQQVKPIVQKKNPSFYEIQNTFNEYYGSHHEDSLEDGEYEKYKRWEWFWEQRVNAKGEFPKNTVVWDEWKKYSGQKRINNSFSTQSGNWAFLGPATANQPALPCYRTGIGRVSCIAFHPTDGNTFWVGTPAGGLWKTSDGGATWNTNTDNLPVLGISDIAINYSNPNIMYVATGDGDFGNLSALTGSSPLGDTKSIGILKSTDGGVTWNPTGLNWNLTSPKLIRKLIIDQSNPQILLAATSVGVYKTTDGGATWNPQTAAQCFTDIKFNPGNSAIVYASTLSTAGNANIFRSTDEGTTWNQVTFWSGFIRIELATTPLNSIYVDALCSKTDNSFGGLYQSSDNGVTFPLIYGANSPNKNLLGYKYDGSDYGKGQGYYDLVFVNSQINLNVSYLGGVNNWKSTDGGLTWALNNIGTTIPSENPNGVQVSHSDKHYIAYSPVNTTYMYECNDGGIFRTTDGGITWTDLTNGLQISEIYRIGNNVNNSNDVICGLQDNGTAEMFNGLWYGAIGGDGMECIIDPTNGNIEYASQYQGSLQRTNDGWHSTDSSIWLNIPGMQAYSNTYGHPPGAWVTPYVIDPANAQTLYVGYHNVWKTMNRGVSWTQISNFGLASNPMGVDHPIRSLVVAPSSSQTIYAASYDTLYDTHNGGANWFYTPIGSITGNTGDKITYIAVKSSDPYTLWVSISGYDLGNKIFKSIDGGISWTNISGTLPNLPVNCIAYENSSNDGLYIGTDVGVYYRDASMADWILFSTGLPNVVVSELEIHYGAQKIRAGTFGRGLWESSLYSVLTGVSDFSSIATTFSIYPNPSNGIFTVQSTNNSVYTLTIFNPIGEMIIEQANISAARSEFNLSNQPAGVYFVQIKTDKGSITKKIIVNK